jgi:hypothetical protein
MKSSAIRFKPVGGATGTLTGLSSLEHIQRAYGGHGRDVLQPVISAEGPHYAMSVRRVEPFPVSKFFSALTLQPACKARVARVMFFFKRSDLICSPISASSSPMVFAVIRKWLN